MSEFKIIETQEQLDSIIADRLARGRESVRKEYEGFISPEDFEEKTKELTQQIETANATIGELTEKNNSLTGDIESLNKDIADRDSKISKYEADSVKNRIANEYGIPFEFADRLAGSTPEEIKADAEKMASYFAKGAPISTPKAAPEPSEGDGVLSAFKKLNPNLNL